MINWEKDLSFNVLAFNSGSFACRYLLGPATDEKDARILLKFNALKLSGSNENVICLLRHYHRDILI